MSHESLVTSHDELLWPPLNVHEMIILADADLARRRASVAKRVAFCLRLFPGIKDKAVVWRDHREKIADAYEPYVNHIFDSRVQKGEGSF